MVIVVPAFSERDHAEKEVVLAIVACVELLGAVLVSERIDRACYMENHDRADESPGEKLWTGGVQSWIVTLQAVTERVDAQRQKHGNDPVESIQKDKLWIFRQVWNARVVRRHIAICCDPSDVCPDETSLHR